MGRSDSTRGTNVSRQAKAGVTLSVARINKLLRRGNQAKNVSSKAPLYVAGVMETIVDAVVKYAVENARNGPRNSHGVLLAKRVDNTDVIHAVRSDPDLARLCHGFAFGSNAKNIKPIKHILSSEGQKKRKEAKKDRQQAKGAASVGRDAGMD